MEPMNHAIIKEGIKQERNKQKSYYQVVKTLLNDKPENKPANKAANKLGNMLSKIKMSGGNESKTEIYIKSQVIIPKSVKKRYKSQIQMYLSQFTFDLDNDKLKIDTVPYGQL